MKEETNSCNSLLSEKQKKRSKLNNSLFDVQLKIKETKILKEKLEKTYNDANYRLEMLEKKHEWIRHEKKHMNSNLNLNLNISGNDNQTIDESKLKEAHKELLSKSKNMSKNINLRAMDHLAQAEERVFII